MDFNNAIGFAINNLFAQTGFNEALAQRAKAEGTTPLALIKQALDQDHNLLNIPDEVVQSIANSVDDNILNNSSAVANYENKLSRALNLQAEGMPFSVDRTLNGKTVQWNMILGDKGQEPYFNGGKNSYLAIEGQAKTPLVGVFGNYDYFDETGQPNAFYNMMFAQKGPIAYLSNNLNDQFLTSYERQMPRIGANGNGVDVLDRLTSNSVIQKVGPQQGVVQSRLLKYKQYAVPLVANANTQVNYNVDANMEGGETTLDKFKQGSLASLHMNNDYRGVSMANLKQELAKADLDGKLSTTNVYKSLRPTTQKGNDTQTRMGYYPDGAVSRDDLAEDPVYYLPEMTPKIVHPQHGSSFVSDSQVDFDADMQNLESDLDDLAVNDKSSRPRWRSPLVAANSPVTVDELVTALNPYFSTSTSENEFKNLLLNSAGSDRSLVRLPKSVNVIQRVSGEKAKIDVSNSDSSDYAVTFEDGDHREINPYDLKRLTYSDAVRDSNVDLLQSRVLEHRGHRLSPSDVSKMRTILQVAASAGLDYNFGIDNHDSVYMKINDNRGMRVTLMDLDNPQEIGHVRDRNGNEYDVDWSQVYVNKDNRRRGVIASFNPKSVNAGLINSEGYRSGTAAPNANNREFGNRLRFMSDYKTGEWRFNGSQFTDDNGNLDLPSLKAKNPDLAAEIERHQHENPGMSAKDAWNVISREQAMRMHKALPQDLQNYLATVPMVMALGIDPKRSNVFRELQDNYGNVDNVVARNYIDNNRVKRTMDLNNALSKNVELQPLYDPKTGKFSHSQQFGNTKYYDGIYGFNGEESAAPVASVSMKNAVSVIDNSYGSRTVNSNDYALSTEKAQKEILKKYQEARGNVLKQILGNTHDDDNTLVSNLITQYDQLVADVTSNPKFGLPLDNAHAKQTQQWLSFVHAQVVDTVAKGTVVDGKVVENYDQNVNKVIDSVKNMPPEMRDGLHMYADNLYKLVNSEVGTAMLTVNDERVNNGEKDADWYFENGVSENDDRRTYMDSLQLFTSSETNPTAYSFELANLVKYTPENIQQSMDAHDDVTSRLLQERMVQYDHDSAVYLNQLTDPMDVEDSKNHYDFYEGRADELAALQDLNLREFVKYMRDNQQTIDLHQINDQYHDYMANQHDDLRMINGKLMQVTDDGELVEPRENVVKAYPQDVPAEWTKYFVDGKLINQVSPDQFKRDLLNHAAETLEKQDISLDFVETKTGKHWTEADIKSRVLDQFYLQYEKRGQNYDDVLLANVNARLQQENKTPLTSQMDIQNYLSSAHDRDVKRYLSRAVSRGVFSPDISIDNNGIIHWEGHQKYYADQTTAMINDGNYQRNSAFYAPVEGDLGQFFVPSRRKMVESNFHTLDRVDHHSVQETYISGWRGVIQPAREINARGDWDPDDLENFNERKVVSGLMDQAKRTISENLKIQTTKLPAEFMKGDAQNVYNFVHTFYNQIDAAEKRRLELSNDSNFRRPRTPRGINGNHYWNYMSIMPNSLPTAMQPLLNDENLGSRYQNYNPQNDYTFLSYLGHDENHPLGTKPSAEVLQAQYDLYVKEHNTNHNSKVQLPEDPDFGQKFIKIIGNDGNVEFDKLLKRRDFTTPEDSTIANKLYHGQVAVTKVADNQFDAKDPQDVDDQELKNRAVSWYGDRIRFNNSLGEATNTSEIVKNMKMIEGAVEVWKKQHPNEKPFSTPDFKYEIENMVHSRVEMYGGMNIGNFANKDSLGYNDPISSSQGKQQGLVQFMTEYSQVADDGHIIPAMIPEPLSEDDQKAIDNGTARFKTVSFKVPNENGELVEQKFKMAPFLDGQSLTKDQMFKYMSEIPFDRAFIAVEQAAKAEWVDRHTKVALMNLNLMNMEDGSVISADWARKHPVRGADGKLRPLQAGDKLSDVSGDKTTITMVVDPEMSMEEAARKDVIDVVQFMKTSGVDVIKSPLSQISRKNMAQVHMMIDSQNDNSIDVPKGKTIIHVPKRLDHDIKDANGRVYHTGELEPRLDENNLPLVVPLSDEWQKAADKYRQEHPDVSESDLPEWTRHMPILSEHADTRMSIDDLIKADANWHKWIDNNRKVPFTDVDGNEVKSWPTQVFEYQFYNGQPMMQPALQYVMDDHEIDTNATIGEVTSYVTNITADTKVNNYVDDNGDGRKYSNLVAQADAERGATALTQFLSSVDSSALPDFREWLRLNGYEFTSDGSILPSGLADNSMIPAGVADEIRQRMSHPGENRDGFSIDDLNAGEAKNAMDIAVANSVMMYGESDKRGVNERPVLSPFGPNFSDIDQNVVHGTWKKSPYMVTTTPIDFKHQMLMEMAKHPEKRFQTADAALTLYTRSKAMDADRNPVVIKPVVMTSDPSQGLNRDQRRALAAVYAKIGLNVNEFKNDPIVARIVNTKGRKPVVMDAVDLDRRTNDGQRLGDIVPGTINASNEFLTMIEDSDGGDFELPDGMTIALPGNSQAHSISILPKSLRNNIALAGSDGATRVNDYNRDYADMGIALKRYQVASAAFEKLLPDYPKEMFANSNAYDVFQTQRKTMLDNMRRDAWNHSGMQEIVDRMNERVSSQVFGKNGSEIKRAFVRQKIMSNRVKQSSTSVMSNGYDLPIDTIEVSPEILHNLGMVVDNKTGYAYMKDHPEWDMIHVHRDPVWRAHGSLGFKVKVNPSITGVRVSPVVVSLMDGDFDGDTLGLIAVEDDAAQRDLHDMINVTNNLYDQHDSHKLGSTDMNISGEMIDMAARGHFKMDMVHDFGGYVPKEMLALTKTKPEDWNFGDITTDEGKQKLFEMASKVYPTDKSLQNIDPAKINTKKALKTYFSLGLDAMTREKERLESTGQYKLEFVNRELSDNYGHDFDNKLNGSVSQIGWNDPSKRIREFVDRATESVRQDNPYRLTGAGLDCTSEETAKKRYTELVKSGSKGSMTAIAEMFGHDYLHNDPLFNPQIQSYAREINEFFQRADEAAVSQGYESLKKVDKKGNVTWDMSKAPQELQDVYQQINSNYMKRKDMYEENKKNIEHQLDHLGSIMEATKEKSDATGLPGDMQKKLVNALADQGIRGIALANAFGYVMTQATLQIKHDPVTGHVLADLETNAMKDLYNGKYDKNPLSYALVGDKINTKVDKAGNVVPTNVPLGKDVLFAGTNQIMLKDLAKDYMKLNNDWKNADGKKQDFSFHFLNKDQLHEVRKQLIDFDDTYLGKDEKGHDKVCKLTDTQLAEAFDKAIRPALSRWDSETGKLAENDVVEAREVDYALSKKPNEKRMSVYELYGGLNRMMQLANVDVPAGAEEIAARLGCDNSNPVKDAQKAKTDAVRGVRDVQRDSESAITALVSEGQRGLDKIQQDLHEGLSDVENNNSMTRLDKKSVMANVDKVLAKTSLFVNDLRDHNLQNIPDAKHDLQSRQCQQLKAFEDFTSKVGAVKVGKSVNSVRKALETMNDSKGENFDKVQSCMMQRCKQYNAIFNAYRNAPKFKPLVEAWDKTFSNIRAENKVINSLPSAEEMQNKAKNDVYKQFGLRLDRSVDKQVERKLNATDQKRFKSAVKQAEQAGLKRYAETKVDVQQTRDKVLQKFDGNYMKTVFAPAQFQKADMSPKAIAESRKKFVKDTKLARDKTNEIVETLKDEQIQVAGFKMLNETDAKDPVKVTENTQYNLGVLISLGKSRKERDQQSFKKIADVVSAKTDLEFKQVDKFKNILRGYDQSINEAKDQLIEDPTVNNQTSAVKDRDVVKGFTESLKRGTREIVRKRELRRRRNRQTEVTDVKAEQQAREDRINQYKDAINAKKAEQAKKVAKAREKKSEKVVGMPQNSNNQQVITKQNNNTWNNSGADNGGLEL